MARPAEPVEELLRLMREADLPVLLALDRELHLLLERKKQDQLRTLQTLAREEFCERYPHIMIAPELFALVGIHPENPVEKDNALIREQISRRFTG